MAPLSLQKLEVPLAQGWFIAKKFRSFCKAEFTCTGWRLFIRNPESHTRGNPQRGGPFKHLRQTLAPAVHVASSCRLQKSAISHWELPPPAPKPPNYVAAEAWQGKEGGEFCTYARVPAPPQIEGERVSYMCLSHNSTGTWLGSFLIRAEEPLISQLASARSLTSTFVWKT